MVMTTDSPDLKNCSFFKNCFMCSTVKSVPPTLSINTPVTPQNNPVLLAISANSVIAIMGVLGLLFEISNAVSPDKLNVEIPATS